MKTKNLLMAAIMLFGIGITSCSKPEKGDKGDVGPAGTNGTNGTNGNANVHSQTFTISNWTYTAPSYHGDMLYSEITQDINDNGAVLVYLRNSGGGYAQLPLTFPVDATYMQTYEVVSAPGIARIYITDSDLIQPVTPPTLTFKVVTIASSNIIAKNPNVDFSNYNEVAAAFNLLD